MCLNPYCSGQWSRTLGMLLVSHFEDNSLNPYCSGQWSRTVLITYGSDSDINVLILIVVDNGLVREFGKQMVFELAKVLILIVVDNGLVLEHLGVRRVKQSLS